MRPQEQRRPCFVKQFADLAAQVLRAAHHKEMHGQRGWGLNPGSSFVLWRQGDQLCELVAHPYSDSPLMRISGNIGLRCETRSSLLRLGFFPTCPTCRRRCKLVFRGRDYVCSVSGHRVFRDRDLVCSVSGHQPRAKRWRPEYGRPYFELTCLQAELPQLAALSVAIASGLPAEQLLSFPVAHLLENPARNLATPNYMWTVAAEALFESRRVEREKQRAVREARKARAKGCSLDEQPRQPEKPRESERKDTPGGPETPPLAAQPPATPPKPAAPSFSLLSAWPRPREPYWLGKRTAHAPGSRGVQILARRREVDTSLPDPALGAVQFLKQQQRLTVESPPRKTRPWTAAEESALNGAGWRTVADQLLLVFGFQPVHGVASQLGQTASQYCKAHGIEPKRLQKGGHRLTYWPIEAFELGSI